MASRVRKAPHRVSAVSKDNAIFKGKKEVEHQLKILNVRPNRVRGQNFLLDKTFLSKIFGCVGDVTGRHVVEIGAGLGALTEYFSSVESLTLIEIEPKFVEQLRVKYPSARVLEADVTTVNFSEIASYPEPRIPNCKGFCPLVVIGNLPYSQTTDILFHILTHRFVIERAVFLLQKEVAERLASSPNGRVYGVPSVMVQAVAKVTLGPIISGDAFFPSAEVKSRVVILEFENADSLGGYCYNKFSKVVHAAFCKRRKMIHNSLRASGLYTAEQVEAALLASNILRDRRAETLSVKDYLALATELEKTN
jgi:16S rRNA (adenine1518-N6/adenine1519-N6)-dimethyltransferase